MPLTAGWMGTPGPSCGSRSPWDFAAIVERPDGAVVSSQRRERGHYAELPEKRQTPRPVPQAQKFSLLGSLAEISA